MDVETFETLTEVLAFECKDDPSKYSRFCKIFYGDYCNKSPNFIDLGSLMNHNSDPMYVFVDGEPRPALIQSFDMERRVPEYHYGGSRGFIGPGDAESIFNLKIRVRF